MDQKKMDLLTIAIRLFTENGYHSTSVDEIVKESGMSKGSFYKLYPSKEELLVDIVNIIPVQTKNLLTAIYSKNYDSHFDKLYEFVSSSINSVVSQLIPILSIALMEMPLNKRIYKAGKEVSFELNSLLQEFYVHLYGERIAPYIGDIILMHEAVMPRYVWLYQEQQKELEVEKIARFISTVMDIMVEGLIEKQPDAIVGKVLLDVQYDCQDSPLARGRNIAKVISDIKSAVKKIGLGSKELKEYEQSLELLRQQFVAEEPKSFLIKALLAHLQELPQLQDHCKELRRLMNV